MTTTIHLLSKDDDHKQRGYRFLRHTDPMSAGKGQGMAADTIDGDERTVRSNLKSRT